MSFRWTSGRRPRAIRTETLRISAKACSIMRRCRFATSTQCLSKRPISIRAALQYASNIEDVAGSPPVLDLVHLGLGADGHTASLVPGDPVLEVTDADVAVTRPYQGRRRMTLTFPIINRSRRVLWLVTGSEKAGALARLRDRDPSIPASGVRQDRALILADRAAAEQLGASENLEMRK